MPKRNSKDTDNEDIETRIQKLKQEAEEITGGQMISNISNDCPSEIEEQFWKKVVTFEQAEWTIPFDALVKTGILLPPPEELDDAQFTAKLWEVINGLALLRAYLDHTDHLNDRELYAHLWNNSLREELILQPENPDFACHIDLIGSGSEEDISIYLKYYADEEERRRWKEEWPGDAVPEQKEPRFDRDRHLPRAQYGEGIRTH